MNEQTYCELLTLAAKAVKIEGDYEPKYFFGAGPNNHGIYVKDTGWVWNPIDYDGDAFRLAAKLRIEIVYADGKCICQFRIPGKGLTYVSEQITDDSPYAAIRLAIVRAAAEIALAKAKAMAANAAGGEV